MFKGSCLCGGVRFRLSAEPGAFGYCHCRSCRKASGTAFSANAPVDRHHFHLLEGRELLREFESSPGKFRVFCSHCGSPIYAYLKISADVLRVRLGALDTPLHGQAQVHTWVSDKAAWEHIADELPRFDTWVPKAVQMQRGSRQGADD